MCLIVFGYKSIPGYYLIMAANRDEFYERPTRSAGFWKSTPGILAGKDLRAGGTWLGMHRDGRFAAVTNYRDMSSHDPEAKSRGKLVSGYLKSKDPPESYLSHLQNQAGDYNGFNLLAGDLSDLYHYSNVENKINRIEPGIHGISNALMNTPWPKVEEAKKRFTDITDDQIETEANLFDLLTHKKTYPPDQLPETGLSGEMEKAVSACFIQTPDYGTRSSTLVFIKYDGTARFVERVYKPGTSRITEENGFDFTLPEPEHV
ncbi:MAG: NRDE family protein [Balneolaceae bacterium]